MEKKLKTIEEHNLERYYYHMEDSTTSKLNGIACPMCSMELKDTNPMMTLTSNPPKKDIHCDHCGYRGYRLA